jgi:hypothetical protein
VGQFVQRSSGLPVSEHARTESNGANPQRVLSAVDRDHQKSETRCGTDGSTDEH